MMIKKFLLPATSSFAVAGFLCLFFLGTTPATVLGQQANLPQEVAGIPVNYDESKTGTYVLPPLLTGSDGKAVKTVREWEQKRRPEVLRLYAEQVYGKAPGRPPGMHFRVFDQGQASLGGKAVRKQVTIYYSQDTAGPKTDVLLLLPTQAKGPVPLLLNISFSASSTIINDPAVRRGKIWNRDRVQVEAPPFSERAAFPVDSLLAQGIGLATLYYGDIEPDFDGGWRYGPRSLFKKDSSAFPDDQWGAIATWAWGLSRIMDYLETDRAVDAKRVVLLGASRLGKTVLWAGANDQRFASVIGSISGEGGAALSRRNYGETIAHITAPTRYHYQFARNYARYGNAVDKLPVDGHMLIALMAPRPLLLLTGNTDYWSDPKGEFLAAVAAGPVYRLYGKADLGTDVLPQAGTPILHTLGYLMHDGGHTILPADYGVFIQFIRKHLPDPK